MLNKLLKWTLLAAIWRRYGAALSVLPIALVFIVLIFAIHSDYSEYAQISDNKHMLGWSLLAKWLLVVAVILAYWFHVRRLVAKSKAGSFSKSPRSKVDVEKNGEAVPADDPFANIRQKKRLRSQADIVISEKK